MSRNAKGTITNSHDLCIFTDCVECAGNDASGEPATRIFMGYNLSGINLAASCYRPAVSKLSMPHLSKVGPLGLARSGGSQGPALHQRAVKPVGRLESEGPNDSFSLDELWVELLQVDLHEKRHYQMLEEWLKCIEGAIVLLMEHSMGLRECRSEGPDIVSLNLDGGESAGGSGLPRRMSKGLDPTTTSSLVKLVSTSLYARSGLE